MEPTIKDALIDLVPDVVCSVIGVYPDYELDWISPLPQPVTKEQINAKYLELVAQVPAQNNKTKAAELLSATDWVNQPDAIDPARNPHLLNQADFLSYRETIRQIAVNPPSTEVTNWPTLPTEQWSA